MNKLNIHKNLHDVFDIEDDSDIIDGEIISVEHKGLQIPDESSDDSDIDDDVELVRDNIKNLLLTGEDMLETAVELAKNSEQPRAFEIAANMMKQLTDMNHQLLDIHEKKQKLSKKSTDNITLTNNKTINNTVFVGTTSDFDARIEQKIKGLQNAA